mgnify:CR=1 FL=1
MLFRSMNDDLVDNMFSDLDEYYPGSKRKRREGVEVKVSQVQEKTWDKHPYKKTLPSGEDIEMFTIGALADALGRPIPTIRMWMKEGILPPSPYRLPTKKDKNGEDHKGRRLYTRDMIEAAIKIFTDTGLIDQPYIDWSRNRLVTEKLNETWQTLRKA